MATATKKYIITDATPQKGIAKKVLPLRELRMQELDTEFRKQSKKLARLVMRFKKEHNE